MKHLPLCLRMALAVGVAAALCGCASMKRTPPPDVVESADDRLVPAKLDAEASDLPATQPVIEYVPVAAPQPRPMFNRSTTRPQAAPPTAASAASALVNAKNGSTRVPTTDDFLNATQVYDYASGIVYTAVCSPGFVTTIALEPGERITAVTAGDTTRWQLESVQGGAGPEGVAAGDDTRTFVLLKPNKPECETNLVVVTDRRVYQLDLKSVGQPVYHTQISWNYPGFKIQHGIGGGAAAGNAPAGMGDGGGIGKLDLRRVNFNYLVQRQKGDPPRWTPLRAFDDGAKTYIQFPPGRVTSEAPPLFVLGANGDAQVMNYRVKGDYYVVDRLFDRAELRLGEAPQQLVRIVRAEVAR